MNLKSYLTESELKQYRALMEKARRKQKSESKFWKEVDSRKEEILRHFGVSFVSQEQDSYDDFPSPEEIDDAERAEDYDDYTNEDIDIRYADTDEEDVHVDPSYVVI